MFLEYEGQVEGTQNTQVRAQNLYENYSKTTGKSLKSALKKSGPVEAINYHKNILLYRY